MSYISGSIDHTVSPSLALVRGFCLWVSKIGSHNQAIPELVIKDAAQYEEYILKGKQEKSS